MSIGRAVTFFVVLFGVLGSLHYYVWARLVRDPHLPAPWSTIATWTLVALGVSLIAGMPASFFLPRSVSGAVLWVGFTWMGLAFFVVVLLAVSDLARVVATLASRAMEHGPFDAARRLLLHRALAALVAGASLALGGWGVAEVARRVRVKSVRVPLARLTKAKSGYRIAQLSDVHIGPTLGKEWLEEVVAATNALNADLIVITGDLVDGHVATLAEHVRPLAQLRARDGVYFVTGNHEYYSGVDEWLAFLPTLGVRVLRNERVAIGGAEGFDLAGVDDWSAKSHGGDHGADLPRAMAGRDPSRAVVLLAHQPKQITEASALGVDLQLSGHTHGGQLFPFGYLVKLAQPYVGGLHVHEGTAIYVSLGTGYWGPPMRIGSPAEITHIELVTA